MQIINLCSKIFTLLIEIQLQVWFAKLPQILLNLKKNKNKYQVDVISQ